MLLSEANIEDLAVCELECIPGARLKNETQQCKEKILNNSFKDGDSIVIHKGDNKLIANFSQHRAKKDRYNRKKALNALKSSLKQQTNQSSHHQKKV